MRLFAFLTFILLNCSCSNHEQQVTILGDWKYVTAERLGDGSQNDKAAIAEFDKSMRGKILSFYKDSMFKATDTSNGHVEIVSKGKYFVSPDKRSLVMDNQESVKILLLADTLKMYSPNNGVFVWEKK